MRDSSRATIHDVARAAGVSHQTVSNVLRQTGRVGTATRDRVSAAIAALDYRPHAAAASMRTRRTGRLAHPMAIGELGPANTIMLEFIESLATAAGRRNYHLVLSAGGAEGVGDVEQLIRSRAVDAVVLATVRPDDVRVATLARLGFPFACFGRTDTGLPQCWIDIDNRAGAHAATAHLIRAGHARVAFLGYAAQGRWDTEREAGYRDALTAAGLPVRVATPGLARLQVARAIGRLLDRPDPATAIVTGSDVLAGAVYAAAAQRGMRVGSDLAVTGFDGSMVGRLLIPALTTVAIPTGLITERLVTRALAELDGPTGAPGELVVPGLVLGASG